MRKEKVDKIFEEFRAEFVLDEFILKQNEVLLEVLRERDIDNLFNGITNKSSIYDVIDDNGDSIPLSYTEKKGTRVRVVAFLINYSYEDIVEKYPSIEYQDYLDQVSKEFIFYDLKNKERYDYSEGCSEELYLVFYCDSWITTSSIRVIGVMTENHLKDFLVKEIKEGNIEWRSVHSPQDISLKEVRENLRYISFSPIKINDY